MKVSVIMPVYNASRYLEKALKSVINQNFTDYEIIVVDDGSQDGSLEIAENTLKDSNADYKIFAQSNQGASSARNRGIEEARGDYLVFVDDDDWIDENHLKNLYNGRTDFSMTQIVKVDEDGNHLSRPHSYSRDIMETEEFIRDELQMRLTFSFTQLMYKRQIILENDIRFCEDYSYGEDTQFSLKALIFGKDIAVSDTPTYFYLQHEGQATSALDFRRFDFIEALENLALFYEREGFSNLSHLITSSRIPKAIFANMNYLLFTGHDSSRVLDEMRKRNLFTRLKRYRGDFKYCLKIRMFLLNPKLYIKMWKKFKNSI